MENEVKEVQMELTKSEFESLQNGEASAELHDKIVKEMGIDEEKKEEVKTRKVRNEDPFETALGRMADIVSKSKGKEEGLDEDQLCMLRIINKINSKGINFSVWNSCTPGLKDIVNNYAINIGAVSLKEKQMCAKALFLQLAQEMKMDKEWIQLQREVAKANRMPEHMDIYGSVLYDKMVVGSLIRKKYLETKLGEDTENEANIRKAMNTYDGIVDTFLVNMFFINMMEAVNNNKGVIYKNDKLAKRNIDDITFTLEKNKITISESNKIDTLYKLIKAKFTEHAANFYVAGMNEVISHCTNGTTKDLQTLFVQHMMIGVIAYINPDAEVQTEFGKKLMKNFDRYVTFCRAIMLAKDTDSDCTSSIKEALKDKEELYLSAEAQAKEKVETDLLKKTEESPKEEETVKEENNDAS